MTTPDAETSWSSSDAVFPHSGHFTMIDRLTSSSHQDPWHCLGSWTSSTITWD